jgi:hypothetical protein
MNPTPEWNKNHLLSMPSFEPLHPAISKLGANAFPTLLDCNRQLELMQQIVTVHSGKTLHFVPQEYGKLPFEAQYEPRCYLQGEVPTRANNWHDLLNALVWFTFPKAKAAINARHFQALIQDPIEASGSERGAVRDTSTLLDESGVIVVCAQNELAGLLREFKWKELFWNRRTQVKASMGFYLFGHGLYEKALSPYLGMTGQGLIVSVEQEYFTWTQTEQLAYLDVQLAEHISKQEHCRSTRELTPVPVLGIPGWSPENESEAYYDNRAYFRPGRQSRAHSTPLNTAPSSVAG